MFRRTMKVADYHMHTPLCGHASGEPTEYAAHAASIGLEEIGFTEHAPMIRDGFDDWHMTRAEIGIYLENIERARRNNPGIQIKAGLEVDYLPGHEDHIRELWTLHDWDYFIGSVHYISDTFAIDNPHLVSEWQKHDTMEIWTEYFSRLTKAAESGLFQILGHADLCKRFCFYPKEDYTHLFDRLIKAAAKSGMAIELNTAGLRKDCKEIYPHPSLLRMAKQHGVPITFGSDAHKPGDVGMNFDEALQLARDCGYTHRCRFSRKQREFVPF